MAFKKRVKQVVKEELLLSSRAPTTRVEVATLAEFFDRNKNYNIETSRIGLSRMKYVVKSDEYESDDEFKSRFDLMRKTKIDRIARIEEQLKEAEADLEGFEKEYNETFVTDESKS